MKRLLFLLSIFICPMSAVIVSGYKYKFGDTIVYFLAVSHIEEYLKQFTILNDQCNELKKIFRPLCSNGQSAFFVEYDSTDREKNETKKVLDCMNAFLKNNKDIKFKDEDGLKQQFINTHTILKARIIVGEALKKNFSLEDLSSKFLTMEPYKNVNITNFKNELKEIIELTSPNLKKRSVINNIDTIENLYKTYILRSDFTNLLHKLYNRYREQLIINFIEESIKEGKKTIVVIAGANHIEALRKKTDKNVQALKVFEGVTDKNKPSQVSVLKSFALQELFAAPTFWERLKHQAYEWRKVLIPAAVVGAGFAARWWLKSRNKPVLPSSTEK